MPDLPTVQTAEELDEFYSNPDPWDYETTEDDRVRKERLAALVPARQYSRTLDIGCGNGFVTLGLPGNEVVGCDLSPNAVEFATQAAEAKGSARHKFIARSIFDLSPDTEGTFDLIVITGVLYTQYIGRSMTIVQPLIDKLLNPGGVLIHCHIDDWSKPAFPYIMLDRSLYAYREYTHMIEVYQK